VRRESADGVWTAARRSVREPTRGVARRIVALVPRGWCAGRDWRGVTLHACGPVRRAPRVSGRVTPRVHS
jgi:hypothetical protein